MQIASIHNLAFYLELVKEARRQILAGNFSGWKKEMVEKLGRRL
jgi:queuine tRNA-ribosyltransferase